jgi:serine/threonine protein kinase
MNREILDLFTQLVDLPIEDYARELALIEQNNPDLAARLRTLLAHDEGFKTEERHLLHARVHGAIEAKLTESTFDLSQFEFIERLGEGGMGEVWKVCRQVAGQSQTLALKLLRTNLKDPEANVRFVREQRILLQLDHPNIARLYDAGHAQDGRPWLALEWVDGLNIIEHAASKRLGLKARLALFAQLLEALQYAHQRLFVHRDIKPDNILINTANQVKVLDFGIAKQLDSDGLRNTTQRYFSSYGVAPEQLEGTTISVMTDVYALGALLYELLCTETLIDLDAPFSTLQQQVLHALPVPPSVRLSAALRHGAKDCVSYTIPHELDKIVAQALRKNPQERYQSAHLFLQDILAFLENRPVKAIGNSPWYLARKFVIRHWMPLAIAAVSAVGLGVQQYQVRVQRDQAILQSERAEQVSNLLLQAFRSADPANSDGVEITARAVLDQASKSLLTDSLQLETDVGLTTVIVDVYGALGLYTDSANLRARLYERASQLQPGQTKTKALQILAKALGLTGDRKRRDEVTLEARAALQAANLFGGTFEVQQLILESTVQADIPDIPIEEKLASARRAVLLAAKTEDSGSELNAAINLIGLLKATDQTQAALDMARKITPRQFAADAKAEISVRLEIVQLLRALQRYPQALEELEPAKRAISKWYGKDHPYFADLYSTESNIYAGVGNYVKSELLARRALDIAIGSTSAKQSPKIMALHRNLAEQQLALAKYDDAAKNAGLAVDMARRILDDRSETIAYMLDTYARALVAVGQYERAIVTGKEVVHRFEFGRAPTPPGSGRIGAIGAIAESYWRLGERAESKRWFTRIEPLLATAAVSRATKQRLNHLQACIANSIGANTDC